MALLLLGIAFLFLLRFYNDPSSFFYAALGYLYGVFERVCVCAVSVRKTKRKNVIIMKTQREEEKKKVFHFLEDATHTGSAAFSLSMAMERGGCSYIASFFSRRMHILFCLQRRRRKTTTTHTERIEEDTDAREREIERKRKHIPSYGFNVQCTSSCLDIVCDKSVNAPHSLHKFQRSFLAHLIIIMHTQTHECTASIFPWKSLARNNSQRESRWYAMPWPNVHLLYIEKLNHCVIFSVVIVVSNHLTLHFMLLRRFCMLAHYIHK